MSKSLKFKNNNYLDSSGIVHKKELLSDILNNITDRMAGYGEECKVVHGDWNTACGNVSGFYMGYNLENSPKNVLSGNNWFFVIHLSHNEIYNFQIAKSLFNNMIYQRSQIERTLD